ncbi:MAG: primosomal protein N' [Desulfobulbus propionicus]|nr:MAG: primosomal protein N' [Desulfobulbus propionicus]PIE60469.1 MAG: primosomal protein N' [Desulfobulbus propionicus]
MVCYEVAVAVPLDHTLTYGHPQQDVNQASPIVQHNIPVGSCVLVPLGNRKVTGYVVAHVEQDEVSFDYKLKSIIQLFQPTPFFPPHLIALYRWIAEYYHHPLGEVIKTALPSAPSAKSGYRALLDENLWQQLGVAEKSKQYQKLSWFNVLQEQHALTPAVVARIKKDKQQKKQLDALVHEGVVTLEPVVTQSKVQAKLETVYEPGDRQKNSGQLKGTEQKTVDLFQKLYLASHGQPVPRKVVLEAYPSCSPYLKALCEKGVLTKRKQRVYRNPFGETVKPQPIPKTLTSEQESVLDAIIPAIERAVFAPFLLHGVTGCGKTEVYIRAASAALEQGKTVLILVPEIALASQLEAQFYSRFGDSLALFHSGLADGERLDQYQRVLDGTARVVLGARSAVFAPLDKLGVIIVDEEHESAYKQEEGARYHGRDVAVKRAQMASCPIILGSATPSVVSYHNTLTGKYTLLTMSKRVGEQKLPQVQIVDLAKEKRSRPELFFSDQLISAVGDTLEKNQQTLLFVNRRGFSSAMLCGDCGHIVQCRNCQVSMTYHRSKKRLLCHYCDYTMGTNIMCSNCQSTNVKGIGLGVERIEEEVRQLFPHARVARLDSDVAVSRKKYIAILQQVKQREIDILVGTQMIAKGLHFPGITLVGVILADTGLAMPDYRAAERTFSLLAQVNGRAGRGKEPGKVLIQTHQPHHYAIRFAQEHDYTALYEQEVATRSPMEFPPFSRLVNFRLSGPFEAKVEQAAQKTANVMQPFCLKQGLTVLGPAPAPLSKVRNKFRWQVAVKGKHPALLGQMVDHILAHKRALCSSSVTMQVDVDPENLM